MGFKKNNPGCNCCGPPPCEETCQDGSNEAITQIAMEILDLDTAVKFWKRSDVSGDFHDYLVAVLDLAFLNGTYIIAKSLDRCEWPAINYVAATVDYTQIYSTGHQYAHTSIPVTLKYYASVPDGSCPTDPPAIEASTTATVTLSVAAGPGLAEQPVRRIDILVELDSSSDTFQGIFNPTSTVDDNCETISLQFDSNIYATDGTSCAGAYGGGIYNATSTPS